MTQDSKMYRSRPITPGHSFLIICSFSLVALLIWAYLGRLDIETVAEGVVVPSTKIKTVQHLEGGIIRKINYREGDKVKKGAPLVVLEGTASSADLKEIDVRLITLRINLTRFKAELSGANSIIFASDLVDKYNELVNASMKHFNTKQRHIKNLISSQRQSVAQR